MKHSIFRFTILSLIVLIGEIGCDAVTNFVTAPVRIVTFPLEAASLIGRGTFGCHESKVRVHVNYTLLNEVELYVDNRKIKPDTYQVRQFPASPFKLYKCSIGYPWSKTSATVEPTGLNCETRSANMVVREDEMVELILPPLELRWPSGNRTPITPKLTFNSCGMIDSGTNVYNAHCTIEDAGKDKAAWEISEPRQNFLEVNCHVRDY